MFEKKSKKNRMFFDSMIRLLYCECKQPFADRKPHEHDWWLDTLLPSYRSISSKDTACVSLGTNTSKMGFDACRDMLSKREQAIIQAFIDRTYVASVSEAKEKFAELFNDCQLSALNEIVEINKTI